MKDLTFLIVTFLRDEYLFDCIKSIRETYGYEPKIIVGDNNRKTKKRKEFVEKYKGQYVDLPFDSGVSKGRNTLVKKIKTKYTCVGDDDFHYNKNAKVDVLYKFARKKEVDLVGGRVFERGRLRDYQGYIDMYDYYFKYRPIEDSEKITKCDIVFNYFVAKTKLLKENTWDDKIKVVHEHSDFFITLKKTKANVYYHPEPKVLHKKEDIEIKYQDKYLPFRRRLTDRDYFFKKHKIHFSEGFTGARIYHNKTEADKILKKQEGYKEKITFVIKTFKRYASLEKLLNSIDNYCPNFKIVIADDNEKIDDEFYLKWKVKLDIEVIKLPFDSGISKGRNEAIKKIRTPYILLLEDDFVFTKETDIEKFYKIIKSDEKIGVVGGMCLEGQAKVEQHFEFIPELKNGILIQKSDGNNYKQIKGIKAKETSCVLNFALMRRKMLKLHKWDNDLKICEHLDFYLRLKGKGWKIIYTPEVKIQHNRGGGELDYKEYRERRHEFLLRLYNKHRIKQMESLSGKITRVTYNKIKTYKKI